jgi:hypothetical protein
MAFNLILAARQPDLRSASHPAAHVPDDQQGQREKDNARSDNHGDDAMY